MNNNDGALRRESSACEEDEMVATERELAEDAQWKRIQQNTFTRWANEHLKTVNKHIGNLETDLSDGLRLISLIEVLSGKRLPKHNKRPNFRSQKLENVSVALKFLEEGEGIRIVNIASPKVAHRVSSACETAAVATVYVWLDFNAVTDSSRYASCAFELSTTDSPHSTDIVDCKLKLILGLIWTLILHYSISMPMWDGDEETPHGEKGPTPKQRNELYKNV
ncbi:hypothetical protein B566_EDAN012830 [Ephemera danica]|nr:hypothetical protein B566_EDAN012830 [Ephemera danica]